MLCITIQIFILCKQVEVCMSEFNPNIAYEEERCACISVVFHEVYPIHIHFFLGLGRYSSNVA